MKLREFNFEENEKYASIYRKALAKTAPETDETENCTYTTDDGGNLIPATPLGYDKEQLEWDALHDVLVTAFVLDKDYVCWSADGGFSPKDKTNPFETKEGGTLKIFDPVLLVDNFGYPEGFVMFLGEYEVISEFGGLYVKPHFLYLYNGEELRHFRPKKYVGLGDEERVEKEPAEMLDEGATDDSNPCV